MEVKWVHAYKIREEGAILIKQRRQVELKYIAVPCSLNRSHETYCLLSVYLFANGQASGLCGESETHAENFSVGKADDDSSSSGDSTSGILS